ncbi:DUF6155 family protein [Vibrio hyugaensis]|uniref:DUF6155 family protein n=1 Tax=Vibrio hyugaensis TaxID=1534743 RepID=UPI000CE53CD0|nr:DUF6155 family protein [Vibrio hyugaensis]
MSVSKLRAQLKSKSDKELIDEIVDLYKKHDSVKLHYKASLLENDKEVFEYYKAIVKEEFYPKNSRKSPTCRLSVAKKAITDYKKVSPNDHHIAELMMFYVETGVQFTLDYGDINAKFYDGMETGFSNALAFITKTEQSECFVDRADAILESTVSMGWGFHEGLYSIFMDFFPDYYSEDE